MSPGAGGNLFRQVRGVEVAPVGQNHGALQRVFQLPHITRPVIGHQHIEDIVVHPLKGDPRFFHVGADEGARQLGDVLPVVAQGRTLDTHDAQAVVEVRPEGAVGHRLL